MRISIGLCLACLSLVLHAQGPLVKGKVLGHDDKTALVGVNVALLNAGVHAITDSDGEFALKSNNISDSLRFTFIGYDTVFISLKDYLGGEGLVVEMRPAKYQLEEIVVRRNESIRSTGNEAGLYTINPSLFEKLPSVMGENDPIRALLLTPGVRAANEGNSGLHVRGGAADQNLILYDNASVYNPSHALGFFSVFNGDFLRQVQLIHSGIPPKYGGRISSVLQVNSSEPMLGQFGAEGGIGLISSRLKLSIPIVKQKVALQVAGRRTYLDALVKPVINPLIGDNASFMQDGQYFFQDYNAKLLWDLNARNKLRFSFYQGADYYSLKQSAVEYENDMNWGNLAFSGNWYHVFGDRLLMSNDLVFSKYAFEFEAEQDEISIDLNSNIEDLAIKSLFQFLGNESKHEWGGEMHLYRFRPNNFDAMSDSTALDFGINTEMNAVEYAVHYAHSGTKDRWKFMWGLRISGYSFLGPFTRVVGEVQGISDTIHYAPQEIIATYWNLEPRLSLNYSLGSKSNLTFSYERHSQYVHQASASSVTLPTDIWLPSTDVTKPQIGDQVASGIGYQMNDRVSWSFDLYYKWMQNQVELLYGIINDFTDNTFENSLAYGKGRAYGMEFLIDYHSERMNAWLSYALARSEREFEEIDEGKVFPAKYDRAHDLNLSFAYKLNDRWRASAVFVFASGKAYTLPEYKYLISGSLIAGYGPTNGFRMPNYHRLDLSLEYRMKEFWGVNSQLVLSVYNAYNRYNPFYIYFEIAEGAEGALSVSPRSIVLMPIIPSLTWKFRF